MQAFQIIFDPTPAQVEQIKAWLTEEKRVTNYGFLDSWASIMISAERKEMVIAVAGDQVAGFMTWWNMGKVATIQIAEVAPLYRRKAVGRKMLQSLSERLLSKGVLVLQLHCQPVSSEKVWKKMGFVNFPATDGFERENDKKDPWLFKVISASLIPGEASQSGEAVSLWSVGHSRREKFVPDWHWQPVFAEGTRRLLVPIIYVAFHDWAIQWRSSDGDTRSERVKTFMDRTAYFENFLIITELPRIADTGALQKNAV